MKSLRKTIYFWELKSKFYVDMGIGEGTPDYKWVVQLWTQSNERLCWHKVFFYFILYRLFPIVVIKTGLIPLLLTKYQLLPFWGELILFFMSLFYLWWNISHLVLNPLNSTSICLNQKYLNISQHIQSDFLI